MRIFLSIPVPNVVKNIKQMLTSTCENERVEIRWVKHNNLHLTVQFLGSVSEKKVIKIRREVENIVSSINPFVLTVSGTGCFPNKSKPSVLYLGIGGNVEALKALVMKINDKMSQIGFKKDSELFIPHITVAKINYPQKFNPGLSIFLNSTYDEVEFSVDKIQLLESKTLTEGVVYETLNTFSFLEKQITKEH